jgi:CubicO group peptidase (beta-lactamase class C family)
MKKYLSIILIIVCQIGFAQTEKYVEVINYYHSQKNFNGSVLVATNGKIDFLSGIGIANRQSGNVIKADSKFKILSITKTFTAVLILQLYEEGKLDLKATFGNYFPNYKGEAKDKVTIENLLTYSSGIPNLAEKLDLKTYQLPLSIDDYIDTYCSNKLDTIPGKKSVYNNGDYMILHKIIENITGKSFEKNLEEKILKPLQMQNSYMLKSIDIISGLVNSYTIDEKTNHFKNDEPYYIENFFGSGSMYSTVEDLLKFDSGIFNHKLLSKKTTELMIAPNRALENVAFGFWFADGYGVFNTKFVYRPGGILGSNTNWIHTIENNKSIIVFSNTNATNLYEMSEQLYMISKGEKSTIADLKK